VTKDWFVPPGSIGVRRPSISYFASGLVDTHPFGPEALKHRLERALRYSILDLGKALVLGIDHDHERRRRAISSWRRITRSSGSGRGWGALPRQSEASKIGAEKE